MDCFACRSPINFQNEKPAAAVSEILADYGLPPEMPMLEITEGVILNERSVAIETMNTIRRPGVGLSLDDFGTGYSNPGKFISTAAGKAISGSARRPEIPSLSARPAGSVCSAVPSDSARCRRIGRRWRPRRSTR